MFELKKQVTYKLDKAFLFIIFASFFTIFSVDVIQASDDAASSHATHFTSLQPYNAEYSLKSKQYKMSAKANRSLQIDENNVATLEQEASLLIAKVNQVSKFQLATDVCTLTNISYRYDRNIFGKHKSYKIDFDFNKQELLENNDGKRKTLPLLNSFYDELSYQELLRCQLINTEKIIAGTDFEYLIRTKGKNKVYKFIVSNEELLDTKIGKIETIKLSRVRDNKDGEEENYIWFAKDYNYLLVKIYQKDEDDTLSLDINELKSH